ncbi:MAG TPA: hypothetical protein VFU94_00880 [Conexibacter sp.]|nr:hypothetical protein [Conexibacter sp.]
MPATRSDLSGDLLDATAPAEITVRLADGSRRSLRVTRSEEAQLGSAGIDTTRRFDRAGALARRHGLRALVWLATVVAAAFIAQRAASYYADRQHALDLKASVSTTISQASVRGFEAAFDVADIGAVAHDRSLGALRRANRVLANWSAAVAEIEPLVLIHFEDSRFQTEWDGYEHAMFTYLDLAYVVKGSARAGIIAGIRHYLVGYPPASPMLDLRRDDRWGLLACHPLRCSESDTWVQAYAALGLTLLRERQRLTRALLASRARNLS